MENNGSSVLLIFQAPGEKEWETGRPISSTKSSSAGLRLHNAFRTAEKTRLHFNITNTVQCFPGKREVCDSEKPRDRPPTALARARCSKWLRNDIESYNYDRIVVFGSHAKKSVISLGYGESERFRFARHPSGGLSNADLLALVG